MFLSVLIWNLEVVQRFYGITNPLQLMDKFVTQAECFFHWRIQLNEI